MKIKLLLLLVSALFTTACTLSIKDKQPDAGVFYSNDDGETWQQRVYVGTSNKKRVTIGNYSSAFYVFHPTNENIVYVSTRENGVYVTENKGESWKSAGLTGSFFSSFVIDPLTPEIQYASAGTTIMKTANSGLNWEKVYVEQAGFSVTAIAVDPLRPENVWAGNSKGSILKSEDFGNHWTQLEIAPAGISKIEIADTDPSIMYIVMAKKGYGKSTDGGSTWDFELHKTLKEFRGAIPLKSFYLRPGTVGDIAIGTAHGVLRSTDGGLHWTPIVTIIPENTATVNYAAIDPRDKDKLYFVAGNIFYISNDGGQNWRTLKNIPTANAVTSVYVNPRNPNDYYAGITKVKK